MQDLFRLRRNVAALLVVAALGMPAWAYDFSLGTLVQVSGTSPFPNCTEDNTATQSGTNFSNSEVEPWLSANPANPSNLVGAWQQDRWSNGGSRGLVAGVSVDGGGTWVPVAVPGLTRCSGGIFQRASDPWLSFGPDGTLHLVSLSFDDDTALPFGGNSLLVTNSTDGGLTWGTPATVIHDASPSVLNDKESLTADPTDATLVYLTWDRLSSSAARVPIDSMIPGSFLQPIHPENLAAPRFQAAFSSVGPSYFSRSTDGGQTWELARPIYNPGAGNQSIGNQIVVRPDGTLIDAFNEIRNSWRRTIYRVSFLRSTDHGVTWRLGRRHVLMFPRTLFASFGESVYDPGTGQGVRTGDVIPEIATDPNNGRLYLVWQDSRFSNHRRFRYPNLLIDEVAFSMSGDGGWTWSRPIKINQTPTTLPLGNRQAFNPQVHVSADGTVAVTYYDFRSFDPASSTLSTDYFVVHCHPSASTPCSRRSSWTDEVRLTDASFDLRGAPVAGGLFVGDYAGLAAVGTDFLALFSQPHDADPASIFVRPLHAP